MQRLPYHGRPLSGVPWHPLLMASAPVTMRGHSTRIDARVCSVGRPTGTGPLRRLGDRCGGDAQVNVVCAACSHSLRVFAILWAVSSLCVL